MPDASNLQTSFLGGEWTPYIQGRVDRPDYRSALNVCRNAYPVEEGPWTRRSGTAQSIPTRGGLPARVRSFAFSNSTPYTMEFTQGHLRFFSGPTLALDTAQSIVSSISTADPAVLSLALAPGWLTNDQIMFNLQDKDPQANATNILGRAWVVTKIDSTHYSVSDAVTGVNLDGSTVSLGTSVVVATRILDFVTPYQTADLDATRIVQANNNGQDVVVALHGKYNPYVLSTVQQPVPGLQSFGSFTWGQTNLLDGPYFDPPADGSFLTPSGTAGQITLTVSYTAWSGSTSYQIGDSVTYAGHSYTSLINGNLNNQPDISTSDWQLNSSGTAGINNGNGFQQTDVGRAIRLLSEPAAWNIGTAYAIGNTVKWNGAYYQALKANTGGGSTNTQPDLDTIDWAVTTSAYTWTWATVLSVQSTTQVTVQLRGGNLLYTLPIHTYRLGVYSTTTGFPTCGCFSDGRLWLGGAQPNRFDASKSNDIFNFAPTYPDGTVADDSAIAEVFNAKDANTIYWFHPEAQGIVAGTKGGEWFITASNLNDPITPTSIKANRVTFFKCAPVEPVRTPLSLCFVQLKQQKVFEYISDVYSGKFSGTNLSLTGKHFCTAGIAELAYVQELYPIVWCRMNDGTLASISYKRESPFGTQPASYSGWAGHPLGSGRSVIGITAGPSQDGTLDALTLVTQDPATGICYVGVMASTFDESTSIYNAWFVDSGKAPESAVWSGSTVKLYGYTDYIGQSLDVWGCGLDLGAYTVAADGSITLTLDQQGSLFTTALFQSLGSQTFATEGVIANNGNPNTGQLPPTAGIQQMIPSADMSGGISVSPTLPDWRSNRTWIMFQGAGTGHGLRYFNYASGAQLSWASAQTIFGNGSDNVQSPSTLGFDGNIYFTTSGANSPVLAQVNSSLQVVSEFGVANSGTSSGATSFANPRSMAPLSCGGVNYLVSTSIYVHYGDRGYGTEVTVISTGGATPISGPAVAGRAGGAGNPPGVVAPLGASTNTGTMSYLTPPDNAGNRYIDEDLGYVSRGETFARGYHAYGSCYVLGGWSTSNSNYRPMGLYRVVVDNQGTPATFINRLGKITPNQIEAGWAHFNFYSGLVYDGTDKNVIFFVGNQAAPAYSSVASYQPWNVVLGSNGHDFGCSPAPGNSLFPQNINNTVTNVDPASALWSNATTYSSGQLVTFVTGGATHYFQSLINSNLNNTPAANNAAIWSSLVTYPSSTQVSYNQNYYTAQITISIVQPGGNPAYSAGTTYASGQVVQYNNSAYQSLINSNTGNQPDTHPADWQLVWQFNAVDWFDYGPCWIDLGINNPTHANYMVKFNTQTGVVQWTLPIDALPPTPDGLNQTNINFGRYAYLSPVPTSGNYNLYFVNTLTGALVSTTIVNGVGVTGGQAYDDYTGRMLMLCNYTRNVGNPNNPLPLGATPAGFTGQWAAFEPPTPVTPLSYYAPFVAGKTFTSQGQLLRALAPQEAGAANGPALGKTRRTHQAALLVQESQGMSIGTDFVHMNPLTFVLPDNTTPLPLSTLFSGIHWTDIDDDYSFDSMLAWQITRPYPATVVAAGVFLHTQDR